MYLNDSRRKGPIYIPMSTKGEQGGIWWEAAITCSSFQQVFFPQADFYL
jgi:hypothetical protein